MKRLAILIAIAVAACGPEPAGEPVTRTEIGAGGGAESDPVASPTPAAATVESPCTRVDYEGISMTHCVAHPGKHRIAMALGPKGSYHRSFAALAGERSADAAPVAFAVNGGMFDEAGAPVGYYVEDGNRRRELVRADGEGNFHLKPNGVFYGSGGSWRVRTTEDFYAEVSDRPRFGTQSGPMLVIDGKLHPEFQPDGPSRLIRNGVGVDAQGRAHFVKSEGPISFGKFAAYFRDRADTPNALFLDGNVSALWEPSRERMDATVPLGPLIVVEEKE